MWWLNDCTHLCKVTARCIIVRSALFTALNGKYIHHSFESHSNQIDFSMKCSIEGCPRKLSIFLSHVQRKHSWHDPPPPPPSATTIVEERLTPPHGAMNADVGYGGDDNYMKEETTLQGFDFLQPASTAHLATRSAALLLLAMKQKYKDQSSLQWVECMTWFVISSVTYRLVWNKLFINI